MKRSAALWQGVIPSPPPLLYEFILHDNRKDFAFTSTLNCTLSRWFVVVVCYCAAPNALLTLLIFHQDSLRLSTNLTISYSPHPGVISISRVFIFLFNARSRCFYFACCLSVFLYTSPSSLFLSPFFYLLCLFPKLSFTCSLSFFLQLSRFRNNVLLTSLRTLAIKFSPSISGVTIRCQNACFYNSLYFTLST